MTKFTKKTASVMGTKGGKNRWANIGPRKRSKMMKELAAKREEKRRTNKST